MKIILTHPTGNSNVRAAAKGIAEAGLLYKFYTSIATFPDTILGRLSGINFFSDLRRRAFPPVLQSYTHMWPLKEIGRMLATKAKIDRLTKHETGFFCIDAVYHNFDRHVSSLLGKAKQNGVGAIYCYEDGALFSFMEREKTGLINLYDLPIGYWRSYRRFLEHERKRWPEWASTLNGFRDSPAKLARKDKELSLADKIFVASQFAAKTLQEYPGSLASIEVIPYGYPPVSNVRNYFTLPGRRPLKLLFVGSLSQRKGIAHLFEAVNNIGDYIELTIVGHKVGTDCPILNIELSKHTWIPTLDHQGILKLMREHDVFVFPSLFEGFGLVITEAMSQGTPVITTERTAGPDLITHGQNGWLIEAGSTEALQAAIENLLHNPALIAETGRAAMNTAAKRPWEVYGKELSDAVIKLVNS